MDVPPTASLIGEFPARPEIAHSWRRAMLSGLRPEAQVDGLTVAEIDRSGRLIHAAAPVLKEMESQLQGSSFGLVLADRRCCIVDRRCGDRTVEQALDSISAVPGCRFDEETTGTNAVATVYELGRGVAVYGPEHYIESMKVFSCYGHPIRNPVTRRLEGILDLTCRAGQENDLLAPFVIRAVRDIEHRLLADAGEARQRLLAAFHTADRRRPDAVVALSDEIVLSNPAALDLLDSADHALLRDLAQDPAAPAELRLRLASGTEVLARRHPVEGAGGVLFELIDLSRERVPVPRRRGSPAGTAMPADLDLERCLGTREPVLIAGEPGSGRSTVARSLAGPEPVAVIDAADLATMGERAWADRLAELIRGHDGLLVVEEMHLLPEVLAVSLSRRLPAPGPARIVLTSAPRHELSGQHACLAATCMARIDLPPLRRRGAELPRLVRAMIAELCPGQAPRMTPSALEVLAAQPWPGNLRELKAVVQRIVAHRRVGDITVRDLPPSHRGSPRARRLTPWEQAEHDAIATALRATGGNKVRAAEHLGISRSTLYNRMRVLGLTAR